VDEISAIRERYKKRANTIPANKYLLTNPHILMGVQEKERKLVKMLNMCGMLPLRDKKILEVGCGTGSNLLDFIRLGALPQNIVGNDLLDNRIAIAKERLPQGVTLICCDASKMDLKSDMFDITLQSTVFTSILDDTMQNRLAQKMWDATKPGGYIIWYDFIHANPYNPDVRAVPVKRMKELFPEGKYKIRRTTLFPFISKAVAKSFYFPYTLINACPFLRMHVLCMIRKPERA
jgi:Methylase involved in ubiquinone/menaquinone biosynthesis